MPNPKKGFTALCRACVFLLAGPPTTAGFLKKADLR